MRIAELFWDDWNEEHTARHGVEPMEVEEVVAGGMSYVARVRGERYGIIGQTDAGRYLTIVVEREMGNVFYVVSARPADLGERRLHARHVRRW